MSPILPFNSILFVVFLLRILSKIRKNHRISTPLL